MPSIFKRIVILLPHMMTSGDFPLTRWASIAGLGVAFGLAICNIEPSHEAEVTASPQALPLKPPLPAAPLPLKPTLPTPLKANPSPYNPKPYSEQPPNHDLPPTASEALSQALESQEAMDFIRMNEGVRYRVYNDSQGYKTIGFGLNLDAPGAAELLNSQGIGYRATLNGRVMSLPKPSPSSSYRPRTRWTPLDGSLKISSPTPRTSRSP